MVLNSVVLFVSRLSHAGDFHTLFMADYLHAKECHSWRLKSSDLLFCCLNLHMLITITSRVEQKEKFEKREIP